MKHAIREHLQKQSKDLPSLNNNKTTHLRGAIKLRNLTLMSLQSP